MIFVPNSPPIFLKDVSFHVSFHVMFGYMGCCDFVMVLLGLLGDVHKGNFTWNLKAFDEFQSLLNLPV